MIYIEQPVIVEGKYDKIKLSSIFDALIISTDGFSVFHDKEKVEMIKFFAKEKGVIILTDSDSAGFTIRNYLKSVIKDSSSITNVYIPEIAGKEKRKESYSAEGLLGVEGMTPEIIIEAFKKAGVTAEIAESREKITKLDLYEDGLIGANGSSQRRREFQRSLGLPSKLSANGLVQILNAMMDRNEYKQKIAKNTLSD